MADNNFRIALGGLGVSILSFFVALFGTLLKRKELEAIPTKKPKDQAAVHEEPTIKTDPPVVPLV